MDPVERDGYIRKKQVENDRLRAALEEVNRQVEWVYLFRESELKNNLNFLLLFREARRYKEEMKARVARAQAEVDKLDAERRAQKKWLNKWKN